MAIVGVAFAELPDDRRAGIDFFAGWYFLNRRLPDRAKFHFERFVAWKSSTRFLNVHARVFLEGMKKP